MASFAQANDAGAAAAHSPSQAEVASLLRQVSEEARDGVLKQDEKHQLKELVLQGTAGALEEARRRLSQIQRDSGASEAGKGMESKSDGQQQHQQQSAGAGGSAQVQLPYGGNMAEAMRKQDRDAIRILMEHRKRTREAAAQAKAAALAQKQAEGQAGGDVCPVASAPGSGSSSDQSAAAQAGVQLLRQASGCPCALNCGDNSVDTLVKLPACEHKMHQACLEGLLKTRASACPLCRASLENLRTQQHFAVIDREIENQLEADIAAAIAASLSGV